MIIHMRHSLRGKPVCWGYTNPAEDTKMTNNIDDVTCVDCLRRLAKDAVLYGNDRRAKRW